MQKNSSFFSCTGCQYKSIKWLGCCPECSQWSTFEEVKKATQNPLSTHAAKQKSSAPSSLPKTLDTISLKRESRIKTGIDEWDRVVGDGLVEGSFLVLTGDPGIGKSTLLLQVAARLAMQHTVVYFATEESLRQVKERALRIGLEDSSLLFSDLVDLEEIISVIHATKPQTIIIDSIQNCYLQQSNSFPGTASVLREITYQLMRIAKDNNITTIVSGHVTKEGIIAGPKTVEHMVDAVFYLQGSDEWDTRILRSVKNRFGTTNEVGFFQIKASGIVEVPNINEQLVTEACNAPGAVFISVLEGTRPLLLELQALVVPSKLTIPQRIISGVEHKQVVLIAAMLQKYLKIAFDQHDIFFKISGSLKVKEGGLDLGIAIALLSSYLQQTPPSRCLALGEIALTGLVRPIKQISPFVKEAEKFGLHNLVVSKKQAVQTTLITTSLTNVYDLLRLFDMKKS